MRTGFLGFLVRLSECFAHLGEGRLRLGEPVTVLRPLFMAYLGRFCGSICDCLSFGPLYDLFESVNS